MYLHVHTGCGGEIEEIQMHTWVGQRDDMYPFSFFWGPIGPFLRSNKEPERLMRSDIWILRQSSPCSTCHMWPKVIVGLCWFRTVNRDSVVLHLIQDYDTGVGRGIQQSHQNSTPGNTGPSGSPRSTFVECRTFVQMPTGMTTLSRQPDMNKKHRIKETVYLGQ